VSGDYIVGAVIGEGLMGPRSTGRYRPSGHPVSLEEVPARLLSGGDFVERLALASRQAATVADSNVAAVYDLVRIGQRLYVVTELVRGRSLPALLGADGSLPLSAVMLIVDAVLAGLEGIHRAGIAHGDVSPDVIVITPAGAVRITELGVAAVLAADPAMPGSPGVEPPEGGAPSVAADLYATGALLRELVSGMRPEESGEVRGPETLVRLVNRSLAGVPEVRFTTATDFRLELETVATQLLGPGWRVQSDLAARATRSLGPQPPRSRLGHTVTVSLAGEPPPPPALSVTPADPPSGNPPPAAPLTDPGTATAPTAESRPLNPAPAGDAVAAQPGPATPFDPEPFAAPEGSQLSEPGAGSPGGGARPPRRRRRRRWIWLLAGLAGLVVVAAAVAAGAVVLLQPPAATPAPTTAGAHPLAVGDDVRLTVQPGTTAGCGTTFTFTATGSVSGSGTLTYQWVRSAAGGSPTFTQLSEPISSDSSFRLTTPIQLTGPATIDDTTITVTFQVLSPQARTASQTIHYVCTH
jgi:serine/threonine-protein kinase